MRLVAARRDEKLNLSSPCGIDGMVEEEEVVAEGWRVYVYPAPPGKDDKRYVWKEGSSSVVMEAMNGVQVVDYPGCAIMCLGIVKLFKWLCARQIF